MQYGIITITTLILLAGCDQPTVNDQEDKNAHVVKQTYLPPPPKKKIKLKDVNDTNFNADYMYPEGSKEKEAVEALSKTPVTTEVTMDKKECIAMITQEKFDKYTAMFGSEAASIKRCKMLKSIR
ncbi:MAG: hypothetical protein EP216_01485 [Epsilonproteobacteria bacterium]|nr:MAG: hypothetical protein EP216_01485 [Campylobacterota bacterium]